MLSRRRVCHVPSHGRGGGDGRAVRGRTPTIPKHPFSRAVTERRDQHGIPRSERMNDRTAVLWFCLLMCRPYTGRAGHGRGGRAYTPPSENAQVDGTLRGRISGVLAQGGPIAHAMRNRAAYRPTLVKKCPVCVKALCRGGGPRAAGEGITPPTHHSTGEALRGRLRG